MDEHAACFQFGAITNEAFLYKSLVGVCSFLLAIFLRMRLLGHGTYKSLALVTTAKQFSKVVVPTYIPTSNAQEF